MEVRNDVMCTIENRFCQGIYGFLWMHRYALCVESINAISRLVPADNRCPQQWDLLF